MRLRWDDEGGLGIGDREMTGELVKSREKTGMEVTVLLVLLEWFIRTCDCEACEAAYGVLMSSGLNLVAPPWVVVAGGAACIAVGRDTNPRDSGKAGQSREKIGVSTGGSSRASSLGLFRFSVLLSCIIDSEGDPSVLPPSADLT